MNDRMTENHDEATLDVRNLFKSYGKVRALKGVSFKVERGEIFTLVGPNGSGKTTILEIIEGIRKFDTGTVTILGRKPGDSVLKDRIGVMLQDSMLMGNLKPLELLHLFRSFYSNGPEPEECLSRVGMCHKTEELTKNLSHGEKNRLQMAIAIVNNPSVVFLDEPTSGLDPVSRRQIWETIQGLKDDNVTVVLTTHYMEEAQRLSDRVAFLKEGRIIANDRPQNLIAQCGLRKVIELSTAGKIDPIIGDIAGLAEDVRQTGGGIRVLTDDVERTLSALFHSASERGVTVERLEVHYPTLEDVFLLYTGETYTDEDAAEGDGRWD